MQDKSPETGRSVTPEDEDVRASNQDQHPTQPSQLRKDGSIGAIDHEVIDEEEVLEAEIDQLIKKKVPKKRRTLKGAGSRVRKIDNMPPKRIRADDVRDLFPHLGIEHDEQRRLAKIAGSISGLANQLAEK